MPYQRLGVGQVHIVHSGDIKQESRFDKEKARAWMLHPGIVLGRSKLGHGQGNFSETAAKRIGGGDADNSDHSCGGQQAEDKEQLEDSSVRDTKQKERYGCGSSVRG